MLEDDLESLWWVLRRTDGHRPPTSLSVLLCCLSVGLRYLQTIFSTQCYLFVIPSVAGRCFLFQKEARSQGSTGEGKQTGRPFKLSFKHWLTKITLDKHTRPPGSRTQRYRPSAAPHRFTYKYTKPRPTRPRRRATHKSRKALFSRSKSLFLPHSS